MKEILKNLASKILKDGDLKSFLELPLKSQITGLAVFAHLGKDNELRNKLLELEI